MLLSVVSVTTVPKQATPFFLFPSFIHNTIAFLCGYPPCMWPSRMPMPPAHQNRKKVSPGPERHIFSDVSILHGKPPEIKTSAQLSLEENLQGSSSSQALVQPGQAKPGQLAGHPKLRDTKPRLLLMGLRRYGLK